MTIEQIKHELLEWEDFYGQDLADTEAIKKAKTKKELKEILNDHIIWLKKQNLNAIAHAEEFINKMGLKYK